MRLDIYCSVVWRYKIVNELQVIYKQIVFIYMFQCLCFFSRQSSFLGKKFGDGIDYDLFLVVEIGLEIKRKKKEHDEIVFNFCVLLCF